MFKTGACALAAMVAAWAPSASAHGAVVVDSNWTIYQIGVQAYADNPGRVLAQSFTLDTATEVTALEFLASARRATLYITSGIGPSIGRSGVLWSEHFSSRMYDWHTVGVPSLTLGPGEYYFVMESDRPFGEGAFWAHAATDGRENLGAAYSADFGSGDFGPGRSFTSGDSEEALTLRVHGEQTVVPGPGSALGLAFGALALARRRR